MLAPAILVRIAPQKIPIPFREINRLLTLRLGGHRDLARAFQNLGSG
jgi:hypothetical protein